MIATSAQLVFAAALYFAVALTELFGKNGADGVREAVIWFPGNFAMLIAPHAIFLALAALGRAASVIVQAGLIGANLALLAIYALIYVSDGPHIGNLWLLYWPAAAVGILIGALLGYGWIKRGAARHD